MTYDGQGILCHCPGCQEDFFDYLYGYETQRLGQPRNRAYMDFCEEQGCLFRHRERMRFDHAHWQWAIAGFENMEGMDYALSGPLDAPDWMADGRRRPQ